MYAIVSFGGKQYNIKVGDNLFVEKIDKPKGEQVILTDVLMINDDNKSIFGRPFIESAKVTAEIKDHLRGPKIIVFKKRSKKGYKKTIGHRQYLTELLIKNISYNQK